MPSIKVRARGAVLVPDYKQLFAGRKAFVGWKLDADHGEPVAVMEEDGSTKMVRPSAWVSTEEPTELDVTDLEIRNEYRKHLAHGDLAPADQATADFANEGGFATSVAGQPVLFEEPVKASKKSAKAAPTTPSDG